MMPKVQLCWKARRRWLVFLMSTGLWVLAALSALEAEPALALNGSARTFSCQNCYSSGDFVAAGVAQAKSLGLPGLYVIVSQTYARSGFIQVTGQVPACGLSCGGGLLNVSGTALGQDGGPLGSDSELNNIDVGLFAVDRTIPLSVTMLPGCGAQQSDCGPSLATSTDTAVGFWIGNQLEAAGYVSIPSVISIVVEFKNGDVAVFKHTGGDIFSWTWGQKAWNALHQPIDRYGNVKTNQNTSGTGGGTGSGSNGSYVYGFTMYSDCVFNVSESVPLVGAVSDTQVTILTYAPC